MEVTVRIPENLARLLKLTSQSASRRVFEILVAHSYRTGVVKSEALPKLLKLKPQEVVHFLRLHRCVGSLSLEGYESVSDALIDFTDALSDLAESLKKRGT